MLKVKKLMLEVDLTEADRMERIQSWPFVEAAKNKRNCWLWLAFFSVSVEVFIPVSQKTTLADEGKVSALSELQLFYISSDLALHSQELVNNSFKDVEIEESQQFLSIVLKQMWPWNYDNELLLSI